MELYIFRNVYVLCLCVSSGCCNGLCTPIGYHFSWSTFTPMLDRKELIDAAAKVKEMKW